MHIGIDARLYGTRHRGIGRYTEQLIRALETADSDHHYTVFVAKDAAGRVRFNNPRFTVSVADVPHYSISEHIRMPALISRSGVDAMHFTHLNVPYWCPVPYAVTIHDLIVLHFPDTRATNLPAWKYRIKISGYRRVLANAVKKAAAIIAVSEFTKRDIMRHLSAPGEKIHVTHLAADSGRALDPGARAGDDAPLKKFNINGQYLLYVGSAYPHKNLECLIDAYVLLASRYRRNWQLVLAGREDAFYGRVMEYADTAAPASIRRNIIFTGEVSDDELDALYQGAKCFALPSRYEGFGLPALEAARRGTPVACSKTSSLPEVMAGGAAYFDPNSAQSMAATLNKVGGSHLVADSLREAGKARASLFSWQKTATQTVDVYNSFMV